jgi:uncharacterized protein (DUF302 family)
MRRYFSVLLLMLAGGTAMAADGLVTIPSREGPAETLKRLEASIASHGMTLFARIDHAAGAKDAGLELRPTEVVIFGSAKAGTPLMLMSQTVGIDLPLKMLVWQDASGQTSISYNDPAWLAKRHSLPESASPILETMQTALAAIARAAAGEP